MRSGAATGTVCDGARALPELEASASTGARLFAGAAALSDLVLDVEVPLGSVTVSVRDLVRLRPGTVLTLDRLTGEPIEMVVNGTPVARGEVRVHGERFALRVSEILNAPRADVTEEVPLAHKPDR